MSDAQIFHRLISAAGIVAVRVITPGVVDDAVKRVAQEIGKHTQLHRRRRRATQPRHNIPPIQVCFLAFARAQGGSSAVLVART
jgi:hypothetical protein